MNKLKKIFRLSLTNKTEKIMEAFSKGQFQLLKHFGLIFNKQNELESTETLDAAINNENFFQVLAYLSEVILFMKKQSPVYNMMLLYELIDIENKDIENSCKKGCAHCCQQKINLITPEIQMIKDSVDIEQYKESLLKQSKFKNEEWDYNNNCVFLENNICTIYSSRPAVCRHHLVVTDPILCLANKEKAMNVFSFETAISMAAVVLLYDTIPLPNGLLK